MPYATNKKINFINKNDLLLVSLNKYYKLKDNYTKLQNILKNEAKISLRIIDWFVTNYSKKYNIIYEICKNKKEKLYYLKDPDSLCENTIVKQFIVYMNYKSQLKAYSKKQFDPFCRRERIEYVLENGDTIITTIGQLNFFKWAIENQIIEYINDNLEQIEHDMNTSLNGANAKKKGKRSKNKKPKKTPKKKTTPKKTKRKKRNELSISASRGLNKHNVTVTLSFD